MRENDLEGRIARHQGRGSDSGVGSAGVAWQVGSQAVDGEVLKCSKCDEPAVCEYRLLPVCIGWRAGWRENIFRSGAGLGQLVESWEAWVLSWGRTGFAPFGLFWRRPGPSWRVSIGDNHDPLDKPAFTAYSRKRRWCRTNRLLRSQRTNALKGAYPVRPVAQRLRFGLLVL